MQSERKEVHLEIMKPMKTMQINLNRSRAAHDLLKQIAVDMEIDIVLVAEPNIKMTIKEQWYSSIGHDAAIKVLNKDFKVTNSESREGYAWAEIGREVAIYSCYCSPNVSEQEFMKTLHSIQTSISRVQKTNKCVVGGDLNAKNGMWGSPKNDKKGETLVEWLASEHLHILNSGNAPTFVRGASSSHINVTFSSANVVDKINCWMVLVWKISRTTSTSSMKLQWADRRPIQEKV